MSSPREMPRSATGSGIPPTAPVSDYPFPDPTRRYREAAMKAGKGRTFYSYTNRRLDILVDAGGRVINLGLY